MQVHRVLDALQSSECDDRVDLIEFCDPTIFQVSTPPSHPNPSPATSPCRRPRRTDDINPHSPSSKHVNRLIMDLTISRLSLITNHPLTPTTLPTSTPAPSPSPDLTPIPNSSLPSQTECSVGFWGGFWLCLCKGNPNLELIPPIRCTPVIPYIILHTPYPAHQCLLHITSNFQQIRFSNTCLIPSPPPSQASTVPYPYPHSNHQLQVLESSFDQGSSRRLLRNRSRWLNWIVRWPYVGSRRPARRIPSARPLADEHSYLCGQPLFEVARNAAFVGYMLLVLITWVLQEWEVSNLVDKIFLGIFSAGLAISCAGWSIETAILKNGWGKYDLVIATVGWRAQRIEHSFAACHRLYRFWETRLCGALIS